MRFLVKLPSKLVYNRYKHSLITTNLGRLIDEGVDFHHKTNCSNIAQMFLRKKSAPLHQKVIGKMKKRILSYIFSKNLLLKTQKIELV